MPRWFKTVGYPAWFSLVFFTSVYLSFPLDQVKVLVVDIGEKALGKGSPAKVGRHGVDPELTIGSLSPWRLSGVSAERVHVRLASSNPDPGPELDLEEASFRVGLISLLTDEIEIDFDAKLYEGTVTGTLVLAKADLFGEEGATGALVRSIDAELDGVKLDGFMPLLKKIGVPATGTLDGYATLQLGPEPQKEGEGEIVLNADRLTLGPGDLKVFGPITTAIPLIDLGGLESRIVFDKGKGKSDVFELEGRDGNAEADLDIELSKRLALSRLNGDGSFEVGEKFLKDNPKFKSALDFLPGASRAQDDKGRYHFNLRGNLQRPRPSLSRSGGKDRGDSGRRRRR